MMPFQGSRQPAWQPPDSIGKDAIPNWRGKGKSRQSHLEGRRAKTVSVYARLFVCLCAYGLAHELALARWRCAKLALASALNLHLAHPLQLQPDFQPDLKSLMQCNQIQQQCRQISSPKLGANCCSFRARILILIKCSNITQAVALPNGSANFQTRAAQI